MIGIRREDKSKWEARVPLTPQDVARLSREHGLAFQVQTSPIRVFRDEEFRAVGAEVAERLTESRIIIGVKEIPAAFFEPGKTYVFFSHTIKRQPYNMPMLRRIVELGCTLIDYERIVDDQGRRLVFFGRYAGLAGMIDALWALGQRLKLEGVDNPFTAVRRAYEYRNLEHAKAEIGALGERIRTAGLPAGLRPLIVAFTGYGHVSQGAQEIYDLLPVREIRPHEMATAPAAANECYQVVFREEDLVAPVAAGGRFELQDYYQHPEKYRSTFFSYVPHMQMLVNCIYWEAKYPRLLTCAQLRELFDVGHGGPTLRGGSQRPRLRVIADISCDIEGSIECTVRPTEPGEPAYVYEPRTGQVHDGLAGDGPVILAVDILPCELPADASAYFGRTLSPYLPALAGADFDRPLAESGLPAELQRATIVYKGKLTEPYRYLESEIR